MYLRRSFYEFLSLVAAGGIGYVATFAAGKCNLVLDPRDITIRLCGLVYQMSRSQAGREYVLGLAAVILYMLKQLDTRLVVRGVGQDGEVHELASDQILRPKKRTQMWNLRKFNTSSY